MSTQVVVVGSGYAGAGAVKAFEDEVGEGEAELTWISEHDYHLVLHEVHRAIRNPAVEDKITIPVDEIKSPESDFVKGRVVDVDTEDRVVETDDGTTVDYDYLLLGVGSTTAFFGIEGLKEHAHQLKGLDDAKAIHEDVREAAADATRSDPAEVIVGGAGLSGIQTAGEIAEYRDKHRAPLEIKLVEGLDEVFPGNDPQIQGALRQRLEDADVEILTGDFISEADEDAVYLGGGEDEEPEELGYDVLIWTGGITGQPEIENVELDKDERSHRVHAGSDFATSDDRVFAIGDTALVEQGDDDVAPPTAQAAWQAAEVAGANLARAARGAPLRSWTHEDKGTVISVGEEAVAHDVMGMPIKTFGGTPAKLLKKAIATRWIAKVSSAGRGVSAFGDM
ncbi:FAD-dependent pyridine nucleotide-disulfide oxidoreductase [Halorubrum coriense DSM 10284]|uniref:FAD-dependent pyridine nucleotide-disulfide oxidoreductase n=1 Tax=Halorubrum coriense DSM 10284 TaxID=1227466 RepID=M0ELJ4_9EURY|nr:FAD-dependent oxidoreductase [Halorubrum coriense]ELZ47958.1 FAD-dependent pyridine nucleotide-disulfide oxidoreductase [Halorubrum coriense DSM 10284]